MILTSLPKRSLTARSTCLGWSAAEGKANGQQGWQVFVEGMEGKLRCEMNFRDALRAIRYSFLLAKKLNLRINEVQLAALSLDYQQAKEVAKAQVAEAATEVAQEVAAEAEQGEPSDEKSEAAHEFVCCSKMQKFRREHPDAVVIGRKENICSTFKDDAMLVLKLSVKLPSFSLMVRHTTSSRLW